MTPHPKPPLGGPDPGSWDNECRDGRRSFLSFQYLESTHGNSLKYIYIHIYIYTVYFIRFNNLFDILKRLFLNFLFTFWHLIDFLFLEQF